MEGGTLPPLVLESEKSPEKTASKPTAEAPVQADAPVPPVQVPPQEETHTDTQA
jgi:hypothetical protein